MLVDGGSPSCTKCKNNPLLGVGTTVSLLPDHILVKDQTFTDYYKASMVSTLIIILTTYILILAPPYSSLINGITITICNLKAN